MTSESSSFHRFNTHTALLCAGFILVHYILFGMIFHRFSIPVSLLIHPVFLKLFLTYHATVTLFSTFTGSLIAIIPFYQWDYFRRWLRSSLLTLMVLEGVITILLSWGFMKLLSLQPIFNLLESLQ